LTAFALFVVRAGGELLWVCAFAVNANMTMKKAEAKKRYKQAATDWGDFMSRG
jgi:hypothetical protein